MIDFAANARAAKVAKLLFQVPLADTLQAREALARAVATDAQWRASLVSASGVRKPSEDTWRALADAIRARPLASAEEIRASSERNADPFARSRRATERRFA